MSCNPLERSRHDSKCGHTLWELPLFSLEFDGAQSLSMNLVMSTQNSQSTSCVTWQPPKNDAQSCTKRCRLSNSMFPRHRFTPSWCASSSPPIKWFSTSNSTLPTNESRAMVSPYTTGSIFCFATLLNKRGSNTFISLLSCNNSFTNFFALQPDMPRTRPSTLGSLCMNAFSPTANVLSDRVEASLRDDVGHHFWCGTTALTAMGVGIFESVHTPSCLGKVSAVCVLPT